MGWKWDIPRGSSSIPFADRVRGQSQQAHQLRRAWLGGRMMLRELQAEGRVEGRVEEQHRVGTGSSIR